MGVGITGDQLNIKQGKEKSFACTRGTFILSKKQQLYALDSYDNGTLTVLKNWIIQITTP